MSKIPALEGVKISCGSRPLRDKGHTYAPGEVIPDAADWPNLQIHLRRGAVVAEPPVDWRMVHKSFARKDAPGEHPESRRLSEKVAEARSERAKEATDEALEALLLLDEKTNIRRIRRLMSEAHLVFEESDSKAELLKKIDEALK